MAKPGTKLAESGDEARANDINAWYDSVDDELKALVDDALKALAEAAGVASGLIDDNLEVFDKPT